jgi:hypothetical protein
MSCTFCREKSLPCTAEDKVYPPKRHVSEIHLEPELAGNELSLSRVSPFPQLNCLHRHDMNYLQYFAEAGYERELFHLAVSVFPLRQFLLRNLVHLSTQSESLRYAMLSIYKSKHGQREEKIQGSEYLCAYYASAQRALKASQFLEIACSNYFLAYYALIDGSFEISEHYLFGLFSMVECILSIGLHNYSEELHLLTGMWARALGWMSILYYGSFYPFQVDSWTFTPSPMRKLRKIVWEHDEKLRRLLFRPGRPCCLRCIEHHRYYSLRLKFCIFLDLLYNTDAMDDGIYMRMLEYAQGAVMKFLDELYSQPITASMLGHSEYLIPDCELWPETVNVIYGTHRIDFSDQYHLAYRHCFGAIVYHFLSTSPLSMSLCKKIDFVRRLLSAITVTPWQSYLLSQTRVFFLAALKLTWSTCGKI